MNLETKYFHAFNLIPELGPIRFGKLFAHFNSLETAWQAGFPELAKANLEPRTIEIILEAKKKIDPDLEMAKVLKQGIKILSIKDEDYPPYLKEIYSPPPLLYLKGEFKAEDKSAIGVVGSRHPSPYGKSIAPKIVRELAEQGLTIISGLARGIDTLAHCSSLEVGGRTIAVLGSGIDEQSIYPQENKDLARRISVSGAVASEFPPGTPALPQHFPQRNRIISGLSLGVLVIEARERSGALITANYALEQNREVFAIPGSIYSDNSFGPNNLIKSGAKLVSSSDDVLTELNIRESPSLPKQKPKPQSKEEQIIFEILGSEPIHIDKIIKKSHLSPAVCNATLATMEINGKVRNLGGNLYILD